METAHHCTKESDGEDDLISDGECYFIEYVSAEEGCNHKGYGEGDVADACDVGAVFVGDGFGKESVEADTKRGEGNRHEECDGDDGVDLGGVAEEPGEEDKTEEADAIVDRGPKHGAVYFLFFKPARGGDGEEECDDCGHGADESDLISCCAEAGGVDVEEVDGGAAYNAVPADVKVEVEEVGTIFVWDGVLLEKFVEHCL